MDPQRLQMSEIMDHYARRTSISVYGDDARPCDLCRRDVHSGERVVRYMLDSKTFKPPPSTPYIVQLCTGCEHRMLASR
jgi:hypothetical protein